MAIDTTPDSLRGQCLRVTFPDAYAYVPLVVVARNRAAHYADEFGGDVERSLAEDTAPLFADDPGEATEWAISNMNWSDVAPFARLLPIPPPEVKRDHEWLSAPMRVVHSADMAEPREG